MKRLQYFVLIPVVLGIVLLGVGMATTSAVVYAGIAVLFGGSFFTAVVTTAVIVIKTLKTDDKKIDSGKNSGDGKDYKNEAAEEADKIIEINSSYGYDSRVAEAEHQFSHVSKAFKSSGRAEKIGGCLFVIAFLGFLVGGMILLSMDYIVAGLIVFFCSFALILGSLIVIKIKEHISMSKKYDQSDYDEKFGIVKLCVMSSSTSTGGHSPRLSSIVYRVVIEVNGKEYTAYSRKYYNTDEVIPVLLHKKSNIAKIVEPDSELYTDDNYDEVSSSDDYDDDDDTEYDADDYDAYDDGSPDKGYSEEQSDKDEDRSAVEESRSSKNEQKNKARTDVETHKNSAPDRDSSDDKTDMPKTETIAEEKTETKRKPNVGYKGINRKK